MPARGLVPARTRLLTCMLLQTLNERRTAVYELIDESGFGWWIVFVAGVGFLTDAYDVSVGTALELSGRY